MIEERTADWRNWFTEQARLRKQELVKALHAYEASLMAIQGYEHSLGEHADFDAAYARIAAIKKEAGHDSTL